MGAQESRKKGGMQMVEDGAVTGRSSRATRGSPPQRGSAPPSPSRSRQTRGQQKRSRRPRSTSDSTRRCRPANVDPRLRPPARVRASSTLAPISGGGLRGERLGGALLEIYGVRSFSTSSRPSSAPIVMFALSAFAVLKQGPLRHDRARVGWGWVGLFDHVCLLIFMMMPVAMPEAGNGLV